MEFVTDSKKPKQNFKYYIIFQIRPYRNTKRSMYYIGHVTWPFLRPLSYRKAISESAIPLLSPSSVHEAIPIHSLEMGQTKFFSAGEGLITFALGTVYLELLFQQKQ